MKLVAGWRMWCLGGRSADTRDDAVVGPVENVGEEDRGVQGRGEVDGADRCDRQHCVSDCDSGHTPLVDRAEEVVVLTTVSTCEPIGVLGLPSEVLAGDVLRRSVTGLVAAGHVV